MPAQLDLTPLVSVHKSVVRAAFFSGLLIYLETVVTLVLLTERLLYPPVLAAVLLVLIAQIRLARRPARLLAQGKLISSYRLLLLLSAVYLALLSAGAANRNDAAVVAPSLGAFVVLATSWPLVSVMRVAASLRPQLRSVADPAFLLECLSYGLRERMSLRLRSFGGARTRAAVPWIAAGLAAIVASVTLTGLLGKVLGFNPTPLIYAGGFAGTWLAFRGIRHAARRASELRHVDSRPPVLILREFHDDRVSLREGSIGFAGRLSFERVLAAELNRIGPTVSVGTPGEQLPPLGASRDYLAQPDWKPAVGSMIGDAGLVVFVLGASESLSWEFATAVQSLGPARTLTMVPPLKNPAELERRWHRFARMAAEATGVVLDPALPPETVLAIFFARSDPVLIISRKRAKADYQIALRLLAVILRAQPASTIELEAILRRDIPIVSLTDQENRPL